MPLASFISMIYDAKIKLTQIGGTREKNGRNKNRNRVGEKRELQIDG